MSLRDRCKEILSKLQRDNMLRQGSPVDTLLAFVETERGRAADSSLEDTRPLVCYFATEEDRDEFMALMRAAKPGMVARPMPPFSGG